MNPKQISIRPLGQRSIASTFLSRFSNRPDDCKKSDEEKAPTVKGSQLSLSDFLNRKLHRSSVLPSAVKGKPLPFSSPLSGENSKKSASGEDKGGGGDKKVSLDAAFQMFKYMENDKKDSTNVADDLPQMRKRKNKFEGPDAKPSSKKLLVVLGDDSKPTRSRRMNNATSNNESKPLFNHYANGSGWWDDNMSGIDNEEIGCNEVWEGVGCTSLGGIEWH